MTYDGEDRFLSKLILKRNFL